MQKYGLSISLGFLYLGGSVAIFLPSVLDFHRTSFQEKVRIKSNGFQTLILSPNEFKKINWVEKGREFNWQGKLYDVKQINRTSKGVEVECINDEEEESLIVMLETWKKTFPSYNSKIKLHPPFVYFYSSEETFEIFLKADFADVQEFYFVDVAESISHPPEIG